MDLKNCPHCSTKGVLVMSDGRCPNCKETIEANKNVSGHSTETLLSCDKSATESSVSNGELSGSGVAQNKFSTIPHSNTTLKVIGYIFFVISIVLFLYFSFVFFDFINEPVSDVDHESPLGLLLIIGGLAFSSLLGLGGLGRYMFKYSKRTDVSELYKELIVCKLINGFFGILFGVLAICWIVGNSSGGDPLFFPVSIAFTTSSLIFITGLILALGKKVYPSYLFMIIGGILTLPLGIIPLILGISLRKDYSREN